MLLIVDISGDGNQPASPDMRKAATAGVGGAMVKLSGGYSYPNPDHATQVAACDDADLPSGDYHFMREDGHAGAWRQEADYFLSLRQGDKLFALDWERDGWTRSDVLNWLDYTSGKANQRAGLYLNQDFAYRYDVAHEPAFARYWLWLADWTPPADLLRPWRESDRFIWQFTSKGYIAGIGAVDLNAFEGTADDFRNLGKQDTAMLSPVVTERTDWGGQGRIVAEEVTVQNTDTGIYYSRKRQNGKIEPWRIV